MRLDTSKISETSFRRKLLSSVLRSAISLVHSCSLTNILILAEVSALEKYPFLPAKREHPSRYAEIMSSLPDCDSSGALLYLALILRSEELNRSSSAALFLSLDSL